MSKNLYIIEDSIGTVGTQIAAFRSRAIELFIAKQETGTFFAGKLNAYADNGMDGDCKTNEWKAL